MKNKKDQYIPFEDRKVSEDNKEEVVNNNISSTSFIYHFKIIYRVLLLIILFLLAVIVLFIIYKNGNSYQVKYHEKGNINYGVYLKENNYYDSNYLKGDMQYIADLIDYFDVRAKYEFKSEQKVDTKYKYYMTADMVIYDSVNSNKVVYTKSYNLTEQKEINLDNTNSYVINERLRIDYNYYNVMVREFKESYNLTSNSKLIINFHILTDGKSSKGKIPFSSSKNMNIEIPLDVNTIIVGADNSSINDKRIINGNRDLLINNYEYMLIFLSLLVLFIILLINLILFINRCRRKKSLYETKVDKILKKYDKLIAIVKDIIIPDNARVMDIVSFEELLDINHNLKQPILYSEIHKGAKSMFVVINGDDVYRYVLKAVDLDREFNKR